MRLALIALLTFAGLLSFPGRALAHDIFEKTKWTITVEPDDDARRAGAKKWDDTISFKGNKLESEHLKKLGFDAAAYEGDVRGGAIATFKSTQTSDKEGKVEWSGMVTGGDISGDLTWTKKDGTVLKYTFKGSKKD